MQESVAQPKHSGLLLPCLDLGVLVLFVQWNAPEDCEAVGIFAHRIDCLRVRVRIPARRMQDGTVHAGRIHVADRLVEEVRCRAMRRHYGTLRPQMNLSVHDLHGWWPSQGKVATPG